MFEEDDSIRSLSDVWEVEDAAEVEKGVEGEEYIQALLHQGRGAGDLGINALPLFQEALTPDDETIVFIADIRGNPRLMFHAERDCFIRVLPYDADLEHLSHLPNWEVREAVALHGRTDAKTLRRLSNDKVLQVRDAARSNPNFVPAKRALAKSLAAERKRARMRSSTGVGALR